MFVKTPKHIAFVFIVLIATVTLQSPVRAETSGIIALCYHDVHDEKDLPLGKDVVSVTTEQLIKQFSWLQANGYQPVSIDDIIAAGNGNHTLPEKPVLLTFDDGYRSFYTRVFPLLKLFNYPAVASLVGQWMDTADTETVEYGDAKMARRHFMSWQEVKEVVASGLVEVASHTHDMHHGIIANPQQNQQPAATTVAYDNAGQSYETRSQLESRINADLAKSIQIIEKNLGKKTRVLAWPYGAYSEFGSRIANKNSFQLEMTLNGGVNNITTRQIHRVLVANDSTLDDLSWLIREPKRSNKFSRIVHADLDFIYDENPEQQEKNLSRLLDRVKAYHINTVYLQAYADPNGDGVAEALYFPNRHLPMRADLFNRVAWQLRTRTGVEVYAWMPMLAFDIKKPELENAYVTSIVENSYSYKRLSPFSSEARRVIGEIYQDLALQADFAGILFHDDGYLTDFEDSNPDALKQYTTWGLPTDIKQIRANPQMLDDWTAKKTHTLIDWSNELVKIVKEFRPRIKTARNLYSRVLLEPQSELWFAQNYDLFIDNYDYTAVMAMPYMENAEKPIDWLKHLADIALRNPSSADKVVFELQAFDWKKRRSLESDELRTHMRLLMEKGIKHYGYYPDDFIKGNPDIKTIRPVLSLAKNPYRE